METVPFRLVIDAATRFYGIGRADLCGKSRYRHLVTARHVVWWIGRNRCGMSYHKIGREFGADHSTVLWGLRNLEPRMERNEEILRDAERIFTGACRLAAVGEAASVDELVACEKPLRIGIQPRERSKIERTPEPLARIEPDRYEPGSREWFFVNNERFIRGALKALREGGTA